jgi:hypothetical protein
LTLCSWPCRLNQNKKQKHLSSKDKKVCADFREFFLTLICVAEDKVLEYLKQVSCLFFGRVSSEFRADESSIWRRGCRRKSERCCSKVCSTKIFGSVGGEEWIDPEGIRWVKRRYNFNWWLWLLLSGKTSFFVYNQSKIKSLPNDKINEFQHEVTKLEEENKLLSGEVKSHVAGNVSEILTIAAPSSRRIHLPTELAKIKATLTNEEIEAQIVTLQASVWLLFPRAFHAI